MRKAPDEPGRAPAMENYVRERRHALGLSQDKLARLAGITRQAVCAIEAGRYSPATSVALSLAQALQCRVEDLFRLNQAGALVEGECVTSGGGTAARVKVIRVGARTLFQPLHRLGAFMNFAEAADGIIIAPGRGRRRAEVRLLRDRRSAENQILVAGCNPAMFLAAEHVRRRSRESEVVVWSTGSEAAVAALKRGEVHAAGVHILDERSGQSNLPYLRRHLDLRDYAVVTFAAWEQGWIVARGNPRRIAGAADLSKNRLRLVNRESGSGARRLLDHELAAAGIRPDHVPGYERAVGSHLEVAWLIKQGLADAGIGVRAAAGAFGLSFIPLQHERYDLVIAKAYMEMHGGLSILLDTIVSRQFRTDMDALGGYDTRETGKLIHPDAAQRVGLARVRG